MGELENSSAMAVSTASAGEASVSSSGYETTPVPLDVVPPKKKRNLPGMPGKAFQILFNKKYIN